MRIASGSAASCETKATSPRQSPLKSAAAKALVPASKVPARSTVPWLSTTFPKSCSSGMGSGSWSKAPLDRRSS